MITPEPSPQGPGSLNEDDGNTTDSMTESARIDLTSVLDDFMDEEVVDKQGAAIGTLACYWQSASGLLVFLGIKLTGQEGVRVVPGRRSQVDDQHSCIRLGFDAADVESAPCLECSTELDATLERTVYEHFRVGETRPSGALRYFARQSHHNQPEPLTQKKKRKDRTL
jgi:hypothetical protein